MSDAHRSQLTHWIEEIQKLCEPAGVIVCDGSERESAQILEQLCHTGIFTPLTREGSYYARTDPEDVARIEGSVFICSPAQEDAGPTNHWEDPKTMHKRLRRLFQGCMRGRRMYVIPYCMGIIGSPMARYGVELTDSPYVVINMRIMTRMGKKALEKIEAGASFVPGVHSVGSPLGPDEKTSFWPCNKEKVVAHFPKEREVWSYGSGYGGNALIGKKCFALRIASVIARDEGWLAEHMLIMGVKNPEGKKKYFAAAFPSACGKTNLAMMQPTLPGWEVTCVGDDIAWLKFDDEGQLYAVNPEFGFFGVAPGTSKSSNPNAMRTIEKNTIFTNVALTRDHDVWWEGLSPPPSHLTDWKGRPWSPGNPEPASHPNARFTVPITQSPVLDERAFDPKGVPIEGIIFGGRRASLQPLVWQSRSWEHGVLIGASLTSERTAAAKGTIGELRHDPFAMLPFCGYHMGDYFAHWLAQKKPGCKMPAIFGVNWFRKDEKGQFLWPGFGENIRVLEWMFQRLEVAVGAKEEAIGNLPYELNVKHLDVDLKALLKINKEEWQAECQEMRRYFSQFRDRFPTSLTEEISEIERRLGRIIR